MATIYNKYMYNCKITLRTSIKNQIENKHRPQLSIKIDFYTY